MQWCLLVWFAIVLIASDACVIGWRSLQGFRVAGILSKTPPSRRQVDKYIYDIEVPEDCVAVAVFRRSRRSIAFDFQNRNWRLSAR